MMMMMMMILLLLLLLQLCFHYHENETDVACVYLMHSDDRHTDSLTQADSSHRSGERDVEEDDDESDGW